MKYLITFFLLLSVAFAQRVNITTDLNRITVQSADTIGFEVRVLNDSGDIVSIWNEYEFTGAMYCKLDSDAFMIQFYPLVGKRGALSFNLRRGQQAKVTLHKGLIKIK